MCQRTSTRSDGAGFRDGEARGTVILVGNPAPEVLPFGKWLIKEVRVEGVVHMGEKMFQSIKLMEHQRVWTHRSETEQLLEVR
jgi:hypothetical protein